MPKVNTVTFSETLFETLNTTWNASQNAILMNTKNWLISVLFWSKYLNTTQNIIVEHGHDPSLDNNLMGLSKRFCFSSHI